ncbi:sulfotransferase family protein [Tahibacter caeni]|uniref:sulfotransferase family protein n=1 Tax=Tahibacter caeni TaxID=1453545 RepID=UPI0021486A5F|nr:sulfotransferase [Tahibacter caeni]
MSEAHQAILVLGMHRSGTSALTRVLNLLGAELGSRLMPAVRGNNENGFWENQDAVDIHETLLADLGRNWHDIREMPAGWTSSEAAVRARASIRRLIAGDFAAAPLWALKDPRLCRLVPLWLDVLAEFGIGARFVFVLRSPEEVAASLHARDGWSPAVSRLLWLQHMREAEEATRGHARCVVHFDELIEDWNTVAGRIARELDVTWPVAAADVAGQIATFIDPGARHHAFVPPLQVSDELPEQLYAAFARARVDAAAWDEAARIGAYYAHGAATFGPCIGELTSQVRTADELRHYFEVLHTTELEQLQQARQSLAVQDGLGTVSAVLGEIAAQQERRDAQTRDSLAQLLQQQQGFAEAVGAIHERFAALAADQAQWQQEQAQRDASIRRGIDESGKQIDVQVLGDAVDALAQQMAAHNGRGFWRRWWGGR